MEDANLIRMVLAFIQADNWDKWEMLVRGGEVTLLTEESDKLLDEMLQQAPSGDDLRTTIELRRALLRRCREEGIDAAFAHLKGPAGEEVDAVTPPAARKKLEQMQQMMEESGDPEETMMHPDVYRAVVLRGVMRTYDMMLESQQPGTLDYGQTQLNRAKVLHQLASLRGEDRPKRLHDALNAYNDALICHKDSPRDYARSQSNRAIALYQLAVLPNENHVERLREALEAYDDALTRLDDNPHLYIRAQLNRVGLLRDMAGLPGENRADRLYMALDGFNAALNMVEEDTPPQTYAKIQIPRANLLRELAGLRGEDRPPRMYEALAAYDDLLDRLPDSMTDYAVTQINRASILQEIGDLPGEDHSARLRQAMEAAITAYHLLSNHENAGSQLKTAQRMVNYTRKNIIDAEGQDIFDQWWAEMTGRAQPDWLGGSVRA